MLRLPSTKPLRQPPSLPDPGGGTPRGAKLAMETVRVNGKLVRTVRGKRITARVDLRGLPRGRFRVKIEVRTVDGRKVSATRRYRTCAPKRR